MVSLSHKILVDNQHSGEIVWGIRCGEAPSQRIPQAFLWLPGYFFMSYPVPIPQHYPQSALIPDLFPSIYRYISLPSLFPNGSSDFCDAILQLFLFLLPNVFPSLFPLLFPDLFPSLLPNLLLDLMPDLLPTFFPYPVFDDAINASGIFG
jgi:hypothetical protein